jgi:predicted Zn-dependent protease
MQVVAWVTGNGHRSGLARMAKMTMTSGLANLSPAIGFDELDDGVYLDTDGP